ncbi:MAG: hypothetical protein IAE77_28415 [Prosthecobacter sp.]|jgi:hypothetical protein|uniref:hypothetical protein n=1 Tax=Prosthecobacter sp. TaxID=1965333 RepID=UPI001A097654|nr:hypothetical protein [Prosthecobacter sp.]MBE2287412.1 hypothetical protein [Prosthecobacter sp.]
MTITPRELAGLPSETWKSLEDGTENVFVKPEGAAVMFRLMPVPAHGGTVRSLLATLNSADLLDDEEREAFAADVEAGRKAMNQVPVSPWDT